MSNYSNIMIPLFYLQNEFGDGCCVELDEKFLDLSIEENKDDGKALPLSEFVKKYISKIDTTEKLAHFITIIMKEVFSENHFVTEKQLKYFSTPNVPKRYKAFRIRKKNGGEREINAPTDRLNKIHTILNLILKSLYTPSDAAMGFVDGRSIADNASKHIGQHYVFNIDLKDFFTSISQARVWGRLQHSPFKFSQPIANVVAGLCCVQNAETGKNVLPQGAPTSPLLTNAICDKLDKQLSALARKYGLHYSRYADDITFSSMHNVYQEDSDFRKKLQNIIEEQGFTINEKKTRLLRSDQRQEVTGLTVNSKINVTRKYVKDLRCLLHIWETKGYYAAYSYFYPLYKKEKQHVKKSEPMMENVICGKLNYLRMIKGANNDCYKKLQQRFDNLQQVVYSDENKTTQFVYVMQYTMKDFEEKFSTKISLQISPKKNLVGKCNLCGADKTLYVSKRSRELLCPENTASKVGDIIPSEILNDCYVTLCNYKGKNFWMITHEKLPRARTLSLVDIIIDPDNFFKLWEILDFQKMVKLFQIVLNKSEIYSTEKIVYYTNAIPKMKQLRKKDKVRVEEFLNDDYFKEPATEREIEEFIYFASNFNKFTNSQRLKINRLLAKDYAEHQISDEGKKAAKQNAKAQKKMSPLDVASFLSKFNDSYGLKYLTHDFDVADDDRPQSIEALVKQIKGILDDKPIIPSSLYSLLKSFAFGENPWTDTFGDRHKSSINNNEWKKWSVENNTHPINNPDFSSEIQKFRSTIRIDKGFLKDIIDKASEKTKLNIVQEKTERADFFTNTYILYVTLQRIFRTMNERTDQYPDVTISFQRATTDSGIMLRKIIITQLNSLPQTSLQEAISRLDSHDEAGDFGAIKNNLQGYCLWSVESQWEGKTIRWNILRDGETPETEEIKSEIEGFSHILTFYYV